MKKICYNVELTTIGDDELSVIKTYRDMTGLGVKDAKDKVDAAPCILLKTTIFGRSRAFQNLSGGMRSYC